MSTIDVTIDLFRTTTGLNVREHWARRAKRVKHEHQRVDGALGLRWPGTMPGDPSGFRAAIGRGPYVVTLTRVGPRLADDDNVVAGLKSVRDRVADWLGTGDGPSAPVQWRYHQERGRWAVRIRIESAEEVAA